MIFVIRRICSGTFTTHDSFYTEKRANNKIEMMKIKDFLIIIILLLTAGCEPIRYYNYYIINNCNETIEVKIIDSKKKEADFIIESKMEQLVYSGDFWQPLNKSMVEFFFESIIIKKENDTSKVNYINEDLWNFKVTSKNHSDSYLSVYPKDFEDE